MKRLKLTGELPKLPNGQIDYSKIDRHNDFYLLPALYKTPEDIEKFISQRGLGAKLPILVNLLNLRKRGRLDLTPTEKEFYFQELFDYIYDVYKVPDQETYGEVEKWLKGIEKRLVVGGLSCVIQEAFEFATNRYRQRLELSVLRKKFNPIKVINYHSDIGDVEHKAYYEPVRKDVTEKFWIKCSRWAGQPAHVGDEAYMRVWNCPDKVYIFGCDDCSYSLFSDNSKEREDFINKLKCAAPVWHFGYLRYMHPKLEFTN